MQPSTPQLVQTLRENFASGLTRPLAWRQKQLSGLRALVQDREREIFAAIEADLGKGAFESYVGELGFVLAEIKLAQKNLPKWVKSQRAGLPIFLQPAHAYTRPEPLGLVLIIGPWNYPFHLLIAPLIAALAAGNCAIIKPSELAPQTSKVIAELLPQYVDSKAVAVVEGGIPESTALLAEPFDHIFYTGNGQVGRVVMRAAAEHLCPVTLELGGKNPCYVDRDVDLKVAARRIAWGKYFNAGQTCVAPDHLLVHRAVYDDFVHALRAAVRQFYGPNPQHSPDFPRIISDRHFARLSAMLDQGEILFGGQSDAADRYIAPTAIAALPDDAKLMQDEIFGPILPVFRVDDLDAALERMQALPKPLALYAFSDRDEVADRLIAETSSGAFSLNHTVVHLAAADLPFGGVGPSGMGRYHGRFGFDQLSHHKAVLRKSQALDIPLIYPPYRDSMMRLVRKIM